MPNVNRPSGLSPVKYLGGADWDGKVNIYSIAAADTGAYFPGDPVILSGDGDVNGIPGVTLHTAGANPIIGCVVAVGTTPRGGPYINPNDLTATSRPSGAQTAVYYVAVADDPFILFEIQEDSVAATLAATNLAQNFFLAATTPATGVKVSGWMIDSSDATNNTASPVKLYSLVQRLDNAIGQFAKWIVLLNNHPYKSSGTAGI